MSNTYDKFGRHYNIDDIFSDIYTFNEIAGNTDNVTQAALEAQLKLIEEETKELVQAFRENEGNAQILKETTDLFVVLVGMIQKLEVLGFDWEKAQLLVGQNNIDKFICSDDEQGIKETHEMYKELDIPITLQYDEDFDMYAVVDENGKIRKPKAYKNCDVQKYCPQNWEQLELF